MKAIWKDFLREIRRSRSRFLSILILVALAVAFLSGLRATAPDMKRTCDSYMDEQRFMDIQVLSTLGLTDGDLTALRSFDGVEDGEGAYVIDAYAQAPEQDLVAKVYSLPSGLNQLTVDAGRLPERADECVVDRRLLGMLNVSVGDTLQLRTEGGYADCLAGTEFTIVGTVTSPYYISVERGTSTLGTGQVSAFLYLPRDAFTMDYYTAIYLTVQDAAAEVAFSDGYTDRVENVIDALEPLGEERARLRHDEIVDDANEALHDAEQELADAKEDGRAELEDAERKLSDARKELDDGWQELAEGRETLRAESVDGQQKIADGEAELADALKSLQDGEKEYTSGLADYEQGKKDYETGLAEYEEGLAKYEQGRKDYESGLAEYNAGKAQLDAARRQLESGEAEYESGKAQLDDFVNGYLLPLNGITSSDALGAALMAEGSSGSTHRAVNAALTAFRGQITLLETTVTALNQLENSIPQLQQGLAQADTQIAELENSRTALQAQMDDLDPQSSEYAGLAQQLLQLDAGLVRARATRGGLALQLTQAQSALSSVDAGLAAQGLTRETIQSTLAQLHAAEGKLPTSAADLTENYRQLSDARKELDDGWDAYRTGQSGLAAGQRELQDAARQLKDAEQELADGKREIADGEAELADAKQQLEDARKELDDGWAEYRSGLAELADAKEELKTKVAEAEAELADGASELRKGEAEYRDGRAEYLRGKAEFDEKIGDAERKIADARRDIADIESCEWYILSRDSNPGYLGFGQDADRMGNLAKVFPLLFFLVAALVCLTTMTRMVEEERTQIGCLKALGYTRWQISRKYLGYGLLPALIGGALGLLIGYTLFPSMIFTAYQIMYEVPDIELHQYTLISVLSVLAAVACTTVSSLAACLATLSDVPANLMRPRAPAAGKRVFLEYIRPLWGRLNFNQKVTARNLFRYQKRFWMTVIGIAGCTALIIAGFGLRSSLLMTMDRQYGELYHYNAQITLNSNVLPSERETISSAIEGDSRIVRAQPCYMNSVTAESDRYSITAYLEVLPPDAAAEFLELHSYGSGEPLAVPEDGSVLINQKLSELLGLSVGDRFTLDGEERVEVTVSGIYEHYLAHFVYMSPASYEKVFGEECRSNAYLMQFTDDSSETCDAIFSELMDCNGVAAATRMLDTRDTYHHSMERIDFVVVIVILSAAALALVVLYNLSNINITERKRELATIKVLGFHDREVSAYVNRENVILTIAGIAVGIAVGHLLHAWLVKSVEIDLMMFGRDTDPMAYLWAALLTAGFSLLVGAFGFLKMRKIDMVESLKSAE